MHVVKATGHAPNEEKRVVLLPPTATDAAISERILRQAGFDVAVAPDIPTLCRLVLQGAGAVVITEDAISDPDIESFRAIVASQPVWSDLPVILMVSGGPDSPSAAFALERLGNVVLLDSPVRINNLVACLRAALRDRTRQYATRRYQTELLEQAQRLWNSNKELEQFAYVSSHDLKEPLRKILNYAQLLESRFAAQLGQDGAHFIHMISDGADRMRNLIESLLAFSRLTKTEYKIEPVDLAQTVANVLNDLEVSIREKEAVIKIGRLPSLKANALQMHQLFQNLISNALKFTDSTPRITIHVDRFIGGHRFAVEDNGIGIEPEYREKVFNVFARLHGRGRYPGTGIGLAICKKIVEMHGGKIWVEPAAPHGTRFVFTIMDQRMDGAGAPGMFRPERRKSPRTLSIPAILPPIEPPAKSDAPPEPLAQLGADGTLG
ncbi:MAG: hypothetical protein JO102_06905 [Elusimicrobia bacterium]|nr:hypothetical protein [Elusimicrobiota bacterium]